MPSLTIYSKYSENSISVKNILDQSRTSARWCGNSPNNFGRFARVFVRFL